MPEYSSTTITPADGVQVPSMNGSTSGNFLLSALRDYILASKGQANGLASLGSDGKLTASQLPDLADDVIVVASYAVLPATGTAGKIYITADNNKMYRWDSDLSTPDYVELSVDLSEYATLDDLAAEESAREAADVNLNDALTALDHRVENLEQAKGKYVVSNYKDGSITPSGKGAWAIVEGLRGVSRVENQLVDPANLRTREAYGVTITANADGTITVSGTAEASTNLDFTLNNFGTVGHSYVVCGGKSNGNITINDGTNFATDSGAGAYLANTTGTVKLQFPITNGVNYNVTITPCVTDLNIYFGGSIPSDADTIAEIQQNYPHLLTPSEYGVRIVDSNYSGVRAWSPNLWQNGDVSNPSSTLFTNVTLVEPIKAGTYTFSCKVTTGSGQWRVSFRNSAGSNIGLLNGNTSSSRVSFTVTFTEDAYNAYFYGADSASTPTTGTYTDIQIQEGTTATKYVPYGVIDTLSLTFTGKSAGAVADTCEPNVEVNGVAKKRETQRIGQRDMGTMNWSMVSTSIFRSVTLSDIALNAKGMSTKYIQVASYPLMLNTDKSLWIGDTTKEVYVHDSSYTDETAFKASLSGVPFYYELATYNETLSDPLIDNTLLTEAGGRMATVQTGTVVDGSFDLGFINL